MWRKSVLQLVRWGVVGLAVLGGLLGTPRPAAAHPLGNFTINHYSRIEVYSDRLRIRYVMDMAEIPTFQAMDAIDEDADQQVSESEAERYRLEQTEALRRGLRLQANGSPLTVETLSSDLSFPPGQGELKTLRLSAWFEAPLAARVDSQMRVTFENENPAERVGWNEIVVSTADSIHLLENTASAQDLSNELRAYPDDMLSSPLDVRTALVAYRVLELAVAPPVAADEQPMTQRAVDPFAQLIQVEDLSPAVLGLSVAAAAGYGALHAFTPGHGKAMVGAYLIGSRGTARHALLLGLTVTVTHTIGVYALGMVTLFLAQYILPERLYPILGAVSAALVVVIGGSLFINRLRAARQTPPHQKQGSLGSPATTSAEHSYAYHTHEGADEHTHGGHSHRHLPPAGEAVTLRSLLALGITGGLVPCPTALLVMLGAMALNRVALGLVLIVAFSAGLALVLMGTGLALVYAGRLFERLPVNDRAIRLIGAGGAFTMTLVGMAALAQSLGQLFNHV